MHVKGIVAFVDDPGSHTRKEINVIPLEALRVLCPLLSETDGALTVRLLRSHGKSVRCRHILTRRVSVLCLFCVSEYVVSEYVVFVWLSMWLRVVYVAMYVAVYVAVCV